jgi:hypothetical protein
MLMIEELKQNCFEQKNDFEGRRKMGRKPLGPIN